MFTSWSEVSTPALLSIASVLISPPAGGVLDPAELGEAEVAALADHLGPQVGAVDADRVVGLVADVGVRLGARLDVGADAAVPQQVDRRGEDRPASARPASATGRRRRGRGASRTCARDRDRLGGARVHAAARRDQRRVVVGPGRAGQVEQPRAARRTTSRRRGPGRGTRAGGRTRRPAGCARDSSMPLPNTSPDMSPMPTTVKSSRLGVDAQLAEVALDRLPGAAGGDAHRLVVVADRAAGGERVAEPEAVVDATPRWRCRRTWRCPCRRRPRGRGRRRRAGRPAAAARPLPRRRPGCR